MKRFQDLAVGQSFYFTEPCNGTPTRVCFVKSGVNKYTDGTKSFTFYKNFSGYTVNPEVTLSPTCSFIFKH